MKKNAVPVVLAVVLAGCVHQRSAESSRLGAVRSFDTGYTILHVRTGILNGRSVIVGASYEGTVVAMDFAGMKLWANALTGAMARDHWCGDVNGDGNDEVLVALADGSVHCLNLADGTEHWKQPFKPNDVPMNGVCTVRASNSVHVACGGFDKNFYWLDSNGNLLQTVASSTYSDREPWGHGQRYLEREIGCAHTVNFLRPMPQTDGTDHLILDGIISKHGSHIWEFEPLGTAPLKQWGNNKLGYSSGCLEVADPDGDGNCSLFFGRSGFDIKVAEVTPYTGFKTGYFERFTTPQTYRTSHLTWIPAGSSYKNFVLCGAQILLLGPELDGAQAERITLPYAFNDLWRDPSSGRVLLASSQDGGSAVHVIDTSVSTWKQEAAHLDPPGKIRTIMANHAAIRAQHESFVRPAWERAPDEILCVGGRTELAGKLAAQSGSPKFLGGSYSKHVQNADWKSEVATTTVTPTVAPADEPFLWKVDKRFTHDWTQKQVLDDFIQPKIDENEHGFQMRGGHGNAPYYYQPDTLVKAIDRCHADDPNKRIIINWAELQSTSDNMAYLISRLFDPLLERFELYGNGLLTFNNKHLFYGSTIHKPVWGDFISGKMKRVFRPSLEESTSKTPELSLSARLGLWAAGCLDGWGARTTRDNVSFDRSKQYAGQVLGNHMLRHMIYRYAHGADYSACHYYNLDHQGLASELIASGALFVPRREEIVSFSPVHFSICADMDERYLAANEIANWTTYYDEAEQAANPMVFGRLEACWLAGQTTDFDFSRFAMGVKERRQNFIPPTPHGMVLTTPVENGIHASNADRRNRLIENLHPIYKSILKEHITDGRTYISADGTSSHAANSSYFYSTVKPDVESGARQLPLTVSGDDVAWVCAQTAPKHLRLTLVDSGYLNPQKRTAKVQFHTVKPVKVTDVLTGETIPGADIEVPLGLFRFIDIEIQDKLPGTPREREDL